MNRRHAYIIIMLLALTVVVPTIAQRRITPVNNPSTRTQPRKDAEADSARALEQRRARSRHYHDENGNIVMVDTLTGVEWVDSGMLPKAPPMKYPLLHELSVGVNVFDPLMRAFGQHYGGADAFVQMSLHNRYFPVFEFGLGAANTTPAENNYTYKTPLSPYFKIGLDYNFVYNSNPDYRFFAGLRYGFSPFKFNVKGTLDDPYWGETSQIEIPSTSVTAGWFELAAGLRVHLWGPVLAGWTVKYHSILHRSRPAVGDAWYIPGYGSSTSSLGFAFNIVYTIPFPHREKIKTGQSAGTDGGVDVETGTDTVANPESDNQSP